MKPVVMVALPLAVVAIIANDEPSPASAADTAIADAAADASDHLRVPADYHATYQFLGTWSVAANEGAGAAELHTVYASPGTVAAYRKDGQFPDGAILVKEVYRAATEEMTTGTVSHADRLRGWFVMVRDRSGRHAENELWGDGWGWSWFDAADPSTPSKSLPLPGGDVATTLDYRENCQSCHSPAESTEWIFVEGYPALKP